MQREYSKILPFSEMKEDNKILRELYKYHFVKKFNLELSQHL